MCHQQKWHHRKSPLLFLVLSSIPKQTKTFPTAKRHKSTLNEKIPKGDFRGPRLTSNGRSRFVWNLYARTTLCKWIHKHWICKHALGLKIATKMSHLIWIGSTKLKWCEMRHFLTTVQRRLLFWGRKWDLNSKAHWVCERKWISSLAWFYCLYCYCK